MMILQCMSALSSAVGTLGQVLENKTVIKDCFLLVPLKDQRIPLCSRSPITNA